MPGDRIVINKGAMAELAVSDDMAGIVRDTTEEVRGKAQGIAPVSRSGSHGRRPGYLRANIRTKYGRDRESVYGDVTTNARTPKGFPYGKYIEGIRPYIKPAAE